MVREVFYLKINKKRLIICLVIPLAVGGIAALLTGGRMDTFETLNQPPLSPPAIVFPIVWGILYALMGISAARIALSPPSDERSFGLNLFLSQLAVNFFWSVIFFNLRNYTLAFFWLLLLWGLVLWMILKFRKVDTPAAWLQIPYLLWLSFAAVLSFAVWQLNS